MTIHQLLIQWLLLCMVVVEATEFEFSGDSFTNMEVYDGKIYVGAKNNILVLNATDLSKVDEVSTCTGNCNNINKILLVNRKLGQLITCGTGNYGTCDLRKLNDLQKNLSRSSTDDESSKTYLVVPTNEERPAAFVSTDTGRLYTGVTYGPGILDASTKYFNSYHSFLANFSLSNNSFARNRFLNLELTDENLQDYLVYFKAGFQLNGFVYFVTNQKYKVDSGNYKSKLIRICEQDALSTNSENAFWSYTDIQFECTKNGTVFDLIQDVDVFKPGEHLLQILNLNTTDWILAATFTSGSDPENPGLNSAVCLYTLKDIDEHVLDAKHKFITCNDSNGDSPPEERYLPDKFTQCVNTLAYIGVQDEVECNTGYTSFKYIIGGYETKVSASAVYTSLSADNGVFGNIQATSIGEYTVVHVGTSVGTLIKLNVLNSEKAEVYEMKIIDESHPITGIHLEADGKIEYVMSSRKIVRYEMTDCSMYKTCDEVMKAKNPLCGWCVYEEMSTFKENSTCPYQSYSGHWLSSLTRCLSLDVQPGGVPVSEVVRVTVKITDQLPDALANDTYQCKFNAGSSQEISGVNQNTCKTPTISAHTDETVGLYVNHNGNEILLAETKFLFYDCAHYTRCGDCTDDDRAKCAWDAYNTMCISTNDGGSTHIQTKDKCPKFENSEDIHYLPNGVMKELTFNVTNLVNSTDTNYLCRMNGKIVTAIKVGDNEIKCSLSETTDDDKHEYTLDILYGTSMLDENNTVVIYNCEKLGTDCSVCRSQKYTNPGYECDWCSRSSLASCMYPGTSTCSKPCSPPKVIQVVPDTAALNGSINVKIYGEELGSMSDEVESITLGGVPCQHIPHYFTASKMVTCIAGASNDILSGKVAIVVNNQTSSGIVKFSYKMPQIEGIFPTGGPMAGGTRLTITGMDLDVGGRNVHVLFKDSKQKQQECSDATVWPDVAFRVKTSVNITIKCDTPSTIINETDVILNDLKITFDDATTVHAPSNIIFKYLPNPKVESIRPLKGIASGGNRLTINGKNLKNAHQGYVTGNNKKIDCTVNSQTEMICKVPALTDDLKANLANKVNTSRQGFRKKRDTEDTANAIEIEIIIHLDGVEHPFSIWYYSDPAFDPFMDEKQVKLFESDQQKLTIKGKNLNLVAEKGDVMVTVGVENCTVIVLKEDSLTCVAPTNQPASGILGAELPEVNVSIGNVRANVGYLQYVESQNEVAERWIIIAAVIGSLLAVAVIVVAAVLMKYRQKSKNMRDYQRHVEEQEMEIKQIFREEFADMHTSMLVVNNNLIETGCPYHHYQQYVFNIMFPTDTLESHPLLQEPVVSSKVTDTMRSKMRRGMEEFESLIFNKYFLMSVIYSMEKQRKFGLKDKANMCGYICSILLGRMEYLQEILVDLLGNLVQESAGKKNQKVLFRRCETVTEKLLSNWLSLCLYPHIKSQSGCPLYLLYKATQLHMEAGPIDAVTNDAKYTLSEEKLLKKYSHQSKQGSDEATFEAKCLTLNVVVDNCRDIKVCRVLDCDTITQVKEKCLTQIYVNYPASNLTVNPAELELEWHAGASGSLRLRDEDNTSKRNGRWVRKNTLAHYNVQDGSNMALIDPQVADESHEQDYVNLAQVQLACPSDSSMDSTDAATAILVEPVDRDVRYWHMVKPEEGTLAPGKSSVIAELYLNRLLTFKQSILDYVRAMYDTVLKEDSLPPHVEYLYHLLDDLADRNRVEGDILHAWKSMSYPVRIWATLMKKPSIVFDIKSPPYVETSMDVISQVFIECFSLESHKLSKDSPTNKLIFNNDMTQYKERVKQFYKQVSVKESQPDNLRKYLEEVNRLQQQHISFNKMSALYKLYQQIEPYIIEVIDDLSTNREACKLHLDKKLEQINGLMEEE